MHSTYVFLGPTLSMVEAKKILPDAHYLPPVRCGDILHIMRLKPRRIAIIDGYFDHAPSVWHKEILYAMSQGISVFGASSMGALRAAELEQYGMVGIGKIYQAYRNNPMMGDDEVAIAHFESSIGYQATATSLVDIQTTLNTLVEQAICSESVAKIIISCAKQMNYYERNLEQACALAIDSGVSTKVVTLIDTYLKTQPPKSQKQEDAKDLLACLHQSSNIKRQVVSKQVIAQPIFFRALQLKVDCDVCPYQFDWLPENERIAQCNAKDPNWHKIIRQIAHVMALATHLFDSLNILECLGTSSITLEEKQCMLAFMKLSGEYKEHAVVQTSSMQPEENIFLLEQILQDNPFYFKAKFLLARLWLLVKRQIHKQELKLSDHYIAQYEQKFKQRRHLGTAYQFKFWCRDNQVSTDQYSVLLNDGAWFDYLVNQGNWDALGVIYTRREHWYLKALKLVGRYQLLKMT